MVFFQAVQAIMNLDLAFFIDIAMNNLLWVFMFYAMIHFFMEGKKTVFWFVIWAFLLWAICDWETLTGFVFQSAPLLGLFYLSKFALLGVAEDIPSLKKYLVLVSTISAYFVIIVYTFFLQ